MHISANRVIIGSGSGLAPIRQPKLMMIYNDLECQEQTWVNLNQNTTIFIEQNAFGNAVC